MYQLTNSKEFYQEEEMMTIESQQVKQEILINKYNRLKTNNIRVIKDNII